MNKRFIGLSFHIDTNRINARQKLENMNQLEKWSDNGVIRLEKSEVVLHELLVGSNSQRNKKAISGIYSMTYAESPEEKQKLIKIEEILFPKGAINDNQKNDVEIVFNAYKYCHILITNDGDSKKQPGGILGNAERLKDEVSIIVMTDQEAVTLVEKRIKNRNKNCRAVSKRTGMPLPNWIESD